ncbi:MAG: sensor histidine kinase [Terrimicrobiaceae bacterium]
MIAATQRLVQASVDVVHRFACDLRPTVLDDLGLVPALISQLKDFRKETGIHVEFTSSADVDNLTPARRTILYRFVQTALQDITGHVGTSHVKVSLLKSQEGICLEIHDNGIGVSMEKADLGKVGKRLGLPAMRDQVEMLGGILDVDSGPGKNTTVRVRIPQDLAKPKKQKLKKTAPTPTKCP